MFSRVNIGAIDPSSNASLSRSATTQVSDGRVTGSELNARSPLSRRPHPATTMAPATIHGRMPSRVTRHNALKLPLMLRSPHLHGVLRAILYARSAFDAEVVVYHRIALGILRNGVDRTQLHKRAHMIMRAYFFVYSDHNFIYSEIVYCLTELFRKRTQYLIANIRQINGSTK